MQMKVKLDDEVIFEISDIDQMLLAHDLIDIKEEIKRRLEWVIKHKVEQCHDRLKKEWQQKLENDPSIESIPAKRDEFTRYICCREDYKNRAQREAKQRAT